jgi:hypothetical protein
MKITYFWNMTHSILTDAYQHFLGSSCLQFPEDWGTTFLWHFSNYLPDIWCHILEDNNLQSPHPSFMLNLLHWRRRQYIPPKRLYQSTTLHGIIFQKTAIFSHIHENFRSCKLKYTWSSTYDRLRSDWQVISRSGRMLAIYLLTVFLTFLIFLSSL